MRALITRLPLMLRALVLVPLLAAGIDQAARVVRLRPRRAQLPRDRRRRPLRPRGDADPARLYTSAIAALVGRVAQRRARSRAAVDRRHRRPLGRLRRPGRCSPSRPRRRRTARRRLAASCCLRRRGRRPPHARAAGRPGRARADPPARTAAPPVAAVPSPRRFSAAGHSAAPSLHPLRAGSRAACVGVVRQPAGPAIPNTRRSTRNVEVQARAARAAPRRRPSAPPPPPRSRRRRIRTCSAPPASRSSSSSPASRSPPPAAPRPSPSRQQRGQARRRHPGAATACSAIPKAPITVTEYLDLQCPICAEASKANLPDLINELRPHRQGQAAGAHAAASSARTRSPPPSSPHGAEQQGKLWAFLETFYASQGEENSGYVTDDFLQQVARRSGVDAEQGAAIRRQRRRPGRARPGRRRRADARGRLDARASP